MLQRITVGQLGEFQLESLKLPDGTPWCHHYVQETPQDSRLVTIVVYPEGNAISSKYAARIESAVARILDSYPARLEEVSDELRDIFGKYQRRFPDVLSDLLRELRLTHIKVEESQRIEIIFDVTPFTPSLNLCAELEPDLSVRSVWFDG